MEAVATSEFIDKWCAGFERAEREVQEDPAGEDGGDHVSKEAKTLIQAARLYAENQPSAMHWGVPHERQRAGDDSGRPVVKSRATLTSRAAT